MVLTLSREAPDWTKLELEGKSVEELKRIHAGLVRPVQPEKRFRESLEWRAPWIRAILATQEAQRKAREKGSGIQLSIFDTLPPADTGLQEKSPVLAPNSATAASSGGEMPVVKGFIGEPPVPAAPVSVPPEEENGDAGGESEVKRKSAWELLIGEEDAGAAPTALATESAPAPLAAPTAPAPESAPAPPGDSEGAGAFGERSANSEADAGAPQVPVLKLEEGARVIVTQPGEWEGYAGTLLSPDEPSSSHQRKRWQLRSVTNSDPAPKRWWVVLDDRGIKLVLRETELLREREWQQLTGLKRLGPGCQVVVSDPAEEEWFDRTGILMKPKSRSFSNPAQELWWVFLNNPPCVSLFRLEQLSAATESAQVAVPAQENSVVESAPSAGGESASPESAFSPAPAPVPEDSVTESAGSAATESACSASAPIVPVREDSVVESAASAGGVATESARSASAPVVLVREDSVVGSAPGVRENANVVTESAPAPSPVVAPAQEDSVAGGAPSADASVESAAAAPSAQEDSGAEIIRRIQAFWFGKGWNKTDCEYWIFKTLGVRVPLSELQPDQLRQLAGAAKVPGFSAEAQQVNLPAPAPTPKGKRPSIVPWVLSVGERNSAYAAPQLFAASVLYATPSTVRLKGEGVSSDGNAHQHLVYCVPDESSWVEALRLREEFDRALKSYGAALLSLGNYRSKLAEVGGFSSVPLPLTPTVVRNWYSPEKPTEFNDAWKVANSQRCEVIRHTTAMIQVAGCGLENQYNFWLCPSDRDWEKLSALQAAAERASERFRLYLCQQLGAYEEALADGRYISSPFIGKGNAEENSGIDAEVWVPPGVDAPADAEENSGIDAEVWVPPGVDAPADAEEPPPRASTARTGANLPRAGLTDEEKEAIWLAKPLRSGIVPGEDVRFNDCAAPLGTFLGRTAEGYVEVLEPETDWGYTITPARRRQLYPESLFPWKGSEQESNLKVLTEFWTKRGWGKIQQEEWIRSICGWFQPLSYTCLYRARRLVKVAEAELAKIAEAENEKVPTEFAPPTAPVEKDSAADAGCVSSVAADSVAATLITLHVVAETGSQSPDAEIGTAPDSKALPIRQDSVVDAAVRVCGELITESVTSAALTEDSEPATISPPRGAGTAPQVLAARHRIDSSATAPPADKDSRWGCWVELYCPAGRAKGDNKYFRFVWIQQRRHSPCRQVMHVPGGNSLSPVAERRARDIKYLIAIGTPPEEIAETIKSWRSRRQQAGATPSF